VLPVSAALTACAMPKSATTAVPPESMMFSGLMSAMDHAVAVGVRQAPATSVAMRSASSLGQLLFPRQPVAQRFPSTYGIT